MRKIFLLLIAVSFAVAALAQHPSNVANAQQLYNSGSIKLPKPGGRQPVPVEQMNRLYNNPVISPRHYSHSTKRTTGTSTYSDWYALWNQNTTPGGPQQLYYETVYPDNTLVDGFSLSGAYVFWHGLGMSFDPTDSGYSYNALYSTVSQPLPPTGQSYTIDSFYVPITYRRNNMSPTVTDSVIIEIFVTEKKTTGLYDSGTYNFYLSVPDPTFLPFTYDEMPRNADVRYNAGLTAPYNVPPYINDCYFDSVFTRKYRYALPLNNSNWHDTSGNGCILLNQAAHLPILPLSPAIPVYSSTTHAVSYISFKSGYVYPFGSSSFSANYIIGLEGAPLGSSTCFMQSCANPSISYPGSYQNSLYATDQIRYNDAGYVYNYHNVLIPGSAYTTDYGLNVTLDCWHITWSCTTPTVSAITGSSGTVCAGATITLSDATPAGSWSTVFGYASVTGGFVTGVTAGVDTVVYTVTNGCGSVRATKTVTVNPAPNAGVITGASTVCVGNTITLADAAPGGTWSASNGNATVVGGVVTGVTSGTDIISYKVTNSCGTASATKLITIASVPSVGSISGPSTVCIGSTITLSDATSGGFWTTVTGNAIVTGGVVSGLTVGTDTIIYTIVGSCANAFASLPVTIAPLPVPTIVVTGLTLSTSVPYASYQWIYGATPLSGANGSTYDVLINGAYSVSVIDDNGCAGTSGATIISYVGVQNINALYQIKVYPNPSRSLVNIESSMNAELNVQLTTIDGRLILNEKNVKQIDVTNLPNGNYILSVFEAATNVKIKTERLVKAAN